MDQDKKSLMVTIAVLGGTGKEGKGLAYRWARAGYRVLIGSRSSERAVTAASEIMELLEGSSSVVVWTTWRPRNRRTSWSLPSLRCAPGNAGSHERCAQREDPDRCHCPARTAQSD